MESHPIFTILREVLAALYPEEQNARIVVTDAGLNSTQIAFSSRAQTNWHNILAEAIRQNRITTLLQLVHATYGNNPAFQTAYDQYQHLIDQGGHIEPPASLATENALSSAIETDGGASIAGNVTTEGDLIGRDRRIEGDKVGRDKIEGDQIDARDSKGFINRPTAPVTQNFGSTFHLGPMRISKPVAGILFAGLIAIVILIGAAALYTRGTFQAITAPTPTPTMTPLPTATPLAFASQTVSETLIVIATFHGQAAIAHEPHTKIRRAIAGEATEHGEQQLRVEVEPTELTADQQTEAEALGRRYNASMVIWGEDTGVEIIVNFLNLKEPDFDAASATITERERNQLANPSAYASFITTDLPQTMGFFVFFAIGQSYYLSSQYSVALERIEAAIALVPSDAKPEGLATAYNHLGWLYQVHLEKLDEAIANYNIAIRLDPENVFAYNNRGIVHSDQGKLDEAMADYDHAIFLDTENATLYYNRGNIYFHQGKLDEAMADYNHAIRLAPENIFAYNGLGTTYLHQGKVDEAIVNYNIAIRLDPENAISYYNRGIVHSDQGKLDEAIADYDHAIRLDPEDAATYNNRGLAYSDQGKLDEAIADYDHAIQLDPKYAATYNNRGLAYSDQGKLDEAIADYDHAIQLDPKYATAYNNRGLAYSDQGKLDKAIADYDHAIQLDPKYATAYNNRGLAHSDQGKLDKAIADYDHAIQLDPKYATAYYNRGNASYDQGKLDEAIADYDHAIQLDPKYAFAYYNRGSALSKQGKLDEAIADFEHAIRLDPNDADYNNLCWIYALLQQPTLALPNCQQAIMLDPQPVYYDSQGLAHALLGDLPAAIDDFQKFVDFLESSNDPELAIYLEKRKAWIADLKAGKNPFTPEVLEELRNE